MRSQANSSEAKARPHREQQTPSFYGIPSMHVSISRSVSSTMPICLYDSKLFISLFCPVPLSVSFPACPSHVLPIRSGFSSHVFDFPLLFPLSLPVRPLALATSPSFSRSLSPLARSRSLSLSLAPSRSPSLPLPHPRSPSLALSIVLFLNPNRA